VLPAEPLTRPTLFFVGVTTGQSIIHRVFPRWAAALGLGEVDLRGIDLPVDAAAPELRRAVAYLAAEPLARGALVTTHKIAVARHAADLFAAFDPYARRLGEVSAIARRPDGLHGSAKDPITATLALAALVGRFWWRERPRAEALLLGAGGASLALAAGLLEAPERPAAIALTDRSAERLAHARGCLAGFPGGNGVGLRQVAGPEDTDRLVAALPPGSLVANGTGLGKDRPGSPVSDAVTFPEGGAVWEFNYRGELGFLHQARARAAARRLTVGDGWPYFVYGWSRVVAEVFEIALDPETDAVLFAEAEAARAAA
jgi:shikimate dehydrogenase